MLGRGRAALCSLLKRWGPGPPSSESAATCIRAHLLEAWRVVARDPEVDAFKWLTQGAPASITQAIPCTGISPSFSEPTADMDMADLAADSDAFVNYAEVENDDDAWQDVFAYISKGYILQFDTLADAVQYMGGGPSSRSWP